MSTKRAKELDYEAYMRETAPEREKQSGMKERLERRKLGALKTRITIRLDAEVVEGFKGLVPDGKGYQNLVNQALREWLVAQGVKELLREELGGLVGEAVETIKEAGQAIRDAA